MNSTRSESAISAIEQQLHIPGKYGPWWTGRRLLQECWNLKPDVIRDASFDLRNIPFIHAAKDVSWRRELELFMIGWSVHHFDKNSHYLAAARGVKNGIANPIHLTRDIVPGLPGIYRVEMHTFKPKPFDGVHFPKIIEPGQEWITNDVLLFARQHEYTFNICEAWVFEDYAKILDPWAAKLWAARQALKGQNEEAYREIKRIAVIGLGALATRKELHAGIDLIHPNWWADTVGKARVNILANLLKYGGVPILVETDGIYYVSPDTNWRAAVPGILDRMTECGGFKWEGSCVLTRGLYNETQGLNVGQMASLFKQAGGEK